MSSNQSGSERFEDKYDKKLSESELEVAKLLEDEGSMRISEISTKLDADHEEVRSSMNKLSKNRMVASLPSFEYEFLGEQEQKKPSDDR
ncbi:hypothetical protein [Halorubrum halodurans]|uniref:hypothetical protein n=1 Tax=Halorubrum halodurans TaxID=1383851 RepID=UPI00117B1C8C|nr:hypothetical protein [Halorubrum halodurans]